VKHKIEIIIGLLLLVAVVGSAFFFFGNHNVAEITINATNGTEVSIHSFSWLVSVPPAMLEEMKTKALTDVEDSDSSLGSIQTDMQNIASKYNFTVTVKVTSQFGDNQLPMPATVRGTSMVPTLKDGQDIVVLKTSDFKVGDIVVAHHPEYHLIVKRVSQINGSQVYLTSDNHNVDVSSETRVVNGVSRVVTVTKTPLNTWLPKTNVIGVVKVY